MGLLKKASVGLFADGAPASNFYLLLKRWLGHDGDLLQTVRPEAAPHIRNDLIDRLMRGAQIAAAGLCLLVLFDLTRGDARTGALHSHRAAIFILLGVAAVLMVISALQSERRARWELLTREETQRVAHAAQLAGIGLWGWYPDEGRFWATPTALALLGMPPGSELNMESMLDLVHSDDQSNMRAAMMQAIQTRETQEIYVRQLRDEAVRWYRIRASSGHDMAKRRQLSGSIVDISESRRMEIEMENQRRSLAHLSRVGMLGELGGALAHELKQPLTAILSNAQALQRLLDRKAINMKEVRAVIRDIIEDDSRATDVIHHLRSLLKPGEFQGRTLNLNDVVAETLALVRNDLMTRRIAVSTALHPHSLTVVGDSVQLQQLLLNLIFNAAEAMAEKDAKGGMLLIGTDLMEGPAAHVAVSDTGPGIKIEIMERLFEPFISTKIHGLGLGLSISRAIVASHNGHIWAQNNAGRGATFHVSLPLAGPE